MSRVQRVIVAPNPLILRKPAQQAVSKDLPEPASELEPSFETQPAAAPQDEGVDGSSQRTTDEF
jgi:hypothetical protein